MGEPRKCLACGKTRGVSSTPWPHDGPELCWYDDEEDCFEENHGGRTIWEELDRLKAREDYLKTEVKRLETLIEDVQDR